MKIEIGQTVWGRVCGMFIVEKFETVGDLPGAVLKELDPLTGERGPHPTLFMPFDALRTEKPFKDAELPDVVLNAIRPFVEAKKYNPNSSTSMHTTRVMNVTGDDIAALTALFIALGGEV